MRGWMLFWERSRRPREDRADNHGDRPGGVARVTSGCTESDDCSLALFVRLSELSWHIELLSREPVQPELPFAVRLGIARLTRLRLSNVAAQ
jgi:hypothetical protein